MNCSALTPLTTGRLTLRNRIAFMATVNNLGRNLEITPAQIAFYEARARGGVGMIVTEGMSVHETSIPNATLPLLYDRRVEPGLRQLAEAVHRHDTRLLGQLWHVGRQALWNHTARPWAPSGERDPFSGSTPHAMTEGEIQTVIAAFADGAATLETAGFDGAEIHGAHGYLITQFLSPWSNRRTDRWGGSIENRTRLLVEIVRAIRDATSDTFIIGLKLSAHEYVEGGIDLPMATAFVEHVLDLAPPDYLGISQANFSPSLEYHVPDMRFDDAPFVHLAAGIRAAATGRVPVMAMAKVPSITAAGSLIDDHTADLVGMSRALLADANLVAATEAGRPVRPCVYCNVCWEFIHTDREIACTIAPETGREATSTDPTSRPASQSRQIHVIGGGAAGLEFARVAALRGHTVDVYEATDRLGGRFAWEGTIHGREAMARGATWLEQAARDAGASIWCREEVDASRINSWPQDAVVVLAAGAAAQVSPLPGAERVLSLQDALEVDAAMQGPIVIIDEMEEEPVYAAAEQLAGQGHEVRLVTRRAAIGRRVAYVSLIGVFRRLDEQGITVDTLILPDRIEDGQLIGRHAFSQRERTIGPAGTIVQAGPFRARTAPDLGRRPVVVIGDATAPRNLAMVLRDAHDAALWLEERLAETGSATA